MMAKMACGGVMEGAVSRSSTLQGTSRDAAFVEVEREVAAAFAGAREAQVDWVRTEVRERLAAVKRLRHELAEDADTVARALCAGRPEAEFLGAQLIPLLDACRFLERNAGRLLKTKRMGGAPIWLWGCAHEVRREPHGVVLILGPSNYPFFLPGVQVLQAVVAGNGVILKPGAGGLEAAREIERRFEAAGFERGLVRVLGEEAAFGMEATAQAPDKIFLTGSAETGEQVLAQAAGNLTPCTMELSGCDAVFVLADADLELAARSVAYGLRLNGGRTCIAPRRVFVREERAGEFRRALKEALGGAPVRMVSDFELTGFGEQVLAVIEVEDEEEALKEYGRCESRLGASIFSADLEAAKRFAQRIDAGSICINDLIVPTADGRLPFGGRGRSGFGVTRGEEGLLEMTRLKVVSMRRGKWRPHLRELGAGEHEALVGMARMIYGGAGTRWKAAVELLRGRR